MAKARLLKCDICGVIYEPYNTENDRKRPNCIRLGSTEWDEYFDDPLTHSYGRIDCCPKCMVNIQNHIEYLKLAAREEE